MARWSFLSTHGLALLVISRDPDMRMRDIGDAIGLTERATARIVDDLVADGFLKRERRGVRNHYEVQLDMTMHHPLVRSRTLADFLSGLG